MKKKRKSTGKLILIPAALLLLLFTCISVSAFEIITPGDFWLKAENQGKDNRIDLEWEAGTDVFYTIYQSEDGGITWQTRSSQYGKDIRVLNVYPRNGADQLKTWMETNGFGQGHISVTPVLQDFYNLSPDAYLKDSVTGEYLYDVVVFGFWDGNLNNAGSWDNDLTDVARDATETYIQNGYGVLFGHDTATYATAGTQLPHPNFVYLVEEYTNIEAAYVGTGAGQIPRVGSDKIKSINNGFLLQYPHVIEYEGEYPIPTAHSYGQIANGIIWMEFIDIANPSVIVYSESGGTNNFYLTTWNNTAMIQTGHTSGSSNADEQKVIANVLMYLAQYTDETTAQDQSANDSAAPAAPEAVWGSDVKELTISAEDAGTPFWYKIESTSKHSITTVKTSDIVKEYCTTGIYGYYVIEDKNDYLDFDETMATVTFYPADALEQLDYTLSDAKNYLHVKAVDHNGNVGAAARFSLYDNDMSLQVLKEIDAISEFDQDFVFKLEYRTQSGGSAEEIFYGVVTVPAGSLTGETEFDDILPGVYTVTELDGNWKYELKSGIQRTQTLSLTDPLDNEKEAEYWNDFQPSAWIAGKKSAVNYLKNPE